MKKLGMQEEVPGAGEFPRPPAAPREAQNGVLSPLTAAALWASAAPPPSCRWGRALHQSSMLAAPWGSLLPEVSVTSFGLPRPITCLMLRSSALSLGGLRPQSGPGEATGRYDPTQRGSLEGGEQGSPKGGD